VPPNETRANSRRGLRVRERPLDPASRATEVRSHPRSDCNAPEPNDESPVVVDDETPGAFNACLSTARRAGHFRTPPAPTIDETSPAA